MNAISYSKTTPERQIRIATPDDIDRLVELEALCFSSDRISRRQFRWMITRANAELRLCETSEALLGYVLVLFHKGTSLARLYSLAISPAHQGQGIGRQLLKEAERLSEAHRCVYLRLEVDPRNTAAVALYESQGFALFGTREDYYQDHADACLYQKRTLHTPPLVACQVPYYEQTLDFTCGPASLIMAMRALQPSFSADRTLEVQLWREATTIYMTSGHGGCSPYGLALAAHRRGFQAKLLVNDISPMFLDGVRRNDKKILLELVHADFLAQIADTDIQVSCAEFSTRKLVTELSHGCVPLVLISSWRFNDNKAPHWVVLVAADDTFVYLHDPDVDTQLSKAPGDTQSVPVRIDSFDRMIRFGQSRMQAALCLCPPVNELPRNND